MSTATTETREARAAALATESKKYFKNSLAELVYYIHYSRWMDSEGRRETWIETIDRYMEFMQENIGNNLSEAEYANVRQAMLEQKIVPSMRLMWASGEAARKTNVTAYNCSYIAVEKIEDFGEIMYISMCGTGVGFSVEEKHTSQFPVVGVQTGEIVDDIIVEDSKEGWAIAFNEAAKVWFSGKNARIDYSRLRPAGARLRTMGGRSSGPEPLKQLMEFAKKKILSRQGQKLSTLDIHDICCKIGEIVVAGGVRRSAMISLSDLNDSLIRDAKQGQFWIDEPQRVLSNNSAVYNVKPSVTEFMDEWVSLAKSGTGERGIFNRGGLRTQLPERRWKVFHEYLETSGTNPCGEIVLRSKQFCNLTSIVAREDDTLETLKEKIKWATVLGTYQSTLTDFKFLSPEWKKNCEEERLLGVSITGVWDNEVVRDPEVLRKLRDYAVEVNAEYAKKFGINASTCITCVKPSGNSSQLLDTASGLHTRHAPYYIRRVRISALDPLFLMMKEQGYPYKPEVGQEVGTATTYVLEFPVKSPEGAKTKDELTAIEQLEVWKMFKENFTEHNPSVTISVGDNEWLKTADWVYENWDVIGGLSFLPRNDAVYELAPYEEITKEQYEKMNASLPQIDFARILDFEREDETQGAKELACIGDKCEIV